MKWAHRQAALVEMDLLVFTVGGVRLATPLQNVSGVLSDVSILARGEDVASIPFDGNLIPLVRPENLFQLGIRGSGRPGAVILFQGGSRTYGVPVDSADQVVSIAPGERLYRFLPPGDEWTSTKRPWGFLDLGDVPVLLVDIGPIKVH